MTRTGSGEGITADWEGSGTVTALGDFYHALAKRTGWTEVGFQIKNPGAGLFLGSHLYFAKGNDLLTVTFLSGQADGTIDVSYTLFIPTR